MDLKNHLTKDRTKTFLNRFEGLQTLLDVWNVYYVKADNNGPPKGLMPSVVEYINHVLFDGEQTMSTTPLNFEIIGGLVKNTHTNSGYDAFIAEIESQGNAESDPLRSVSESRPNSFAEQLFHDMRAEDRIIVKGGEGPAQIRAHVHGSTDTVDYGRCTSNRFRAISTVPVNYGGPGGCHTGNSGNSPATQCVVPKTCTASVVHSIKSVIGTSRDKVCKRR